MTFRLSEPPIFTRLSTCERILVAGAGGGFDVYAGRHGMTPRPHAVIPH
jgi:hypothetical protein